MADFTGGLNLFMDGSQVAANSSADMMNVEPLVGGGFRRRNATQAWSAGKLPGPVHSMGTYTLPSGDQQVLFSSNGTMYRNAVGAAWQGVVEGNTDPVFVAPETPADRVPWVGSVWRFIQGYNKAYLYDSLADAAPQAYDGTTVTGLAQTFNSSTPKYGTYLNGAMPSGRAMAMWHGRVWCANTLESGVRYKNRVRWSFPVVNNKGCEDWHPDDYLTVTEDGTEIIALVPAGESLLVFKRNSVHRIGGWDESNFEQFPVVMGSGTLSADSITVMNDRVYYWDPLLGLHYLDAAAVAAAATSAVYTPEYNTTHSAARPVGAALFPVVRNQLSLARGVYVGTVQDRIWCSVPSDSLTKQEGRTYVFDPRMGESGAWWVYDLQVGFFSPFWSRGIVGSDRVDYLAVNLDNRTQSRILALERYSPDADADDFGSSTQSIRSWYRTGWITNGAPFGLKRWALLRVVMQGRDAQSFKTDVYGDWDSETLQTEVSFSFPDSENEPFVVGAGTGVSYFVEDSPGVLTERRHTTSSKVAPATRELRRPIGVPGPGANLLYTPVDPSQRDAIMDDPVVLMDDPGWDMNGHPYIPTVNTGAEGEFYTPLNYTDVACSDPLPGYGVIARSEDATSYHYGRLTFPASHAIQLRFNGALPSKPWAVRGIMLKYWEVEG